MSFSVIDNDKGQLNAKRISDPPRMTSKSPAIRVRQDSETQTRDDQCRVTYLPAAPRNELRAPADAPRTAHVYHAAKRAFDLVVGGTLLVIATPIILIAATAIRLESKGSPFFIQTR